jgi:hypothetical protein
MNADFRIRRLVAVVLVCSGPVLGWGPEGHRIVAMIAAAHLSPAAQSGVRGLLQSDMAEVANWADDVKGRTNSGDWHFIDLAASDRKSQIAARCPRGDCITVKLRAIAANLKAGRSFEQFSTAEELKLVIHLMGDLHQPLHCATNADAGGNCLRTSGFESTELHAAWDTGMLREVLLRGTTETGLARSIDARFANKFADIVKVTDFDDVALESHDVAFQMAYGPMFDKHLLPGQEPRPFFRLSPRECPAKASDFFDLRPRPNLAGLYGNATFDTLRRQLAVGGYRLAEMLNGLFK